MVYSLSEIHFTASLQRQRYCQSAIKRVYFSPQPQKLVCLQLLHVPRVFRIFFDEQSIRRIQLSANGGIWENIFTILISIYLCSSARSILKQGVGLNIIIPRCLIRR